MITPFHLSSKEKRIVFWVTEGLTNKEIAWELRISVGTLKNYLHRLYERLGIPNGRVGLLLWGRAMEGQGMERFQRERAA